MFPCKKVYKPLTLTYVAPVTGPVPLRVENNCCKKKETYLDIDDNRQDASVNPASLNTHALIVDYFDVPDITVEATPTVQGAIWKDDVFMGIGYSTDPIPCEPFYFGGRKIGELYNQMLEIDDDVLHTNSRIMIFREDEPIPEPEPDICCPPRRCPKKKNCNPPMETNYKGAFLKFRECEHEKKEIEVPFMHYKSKACDRRKFRNNTSDVNKLVIVSAFKDGDLQKSKSDRVVLKNKNYSNKCPETFAIIPSSTVSTYITTSPTLKYDVIYTANVNFHVDECGKAIVKGECVSCDEIVFFLKSAKDIVTGKSAPEGYFSNTIKYNYDAFAKRDKEDQLTEGKLTCYYIFSTSDDQNFVDGIASSEITTIHSDTVQTSYTEFDDGKNTYVFDTRLKSSEWEHNPAFRQLDDNVINISFDVVY